MIISPPRQGLRAFASLALTGALMLVSPGLAQAGTRTYALEYDQSQVMFAVDFGSDEIKGQMPVAEADLKLDFSNPARSTVNVSVDASQADTGVDFATQAMKGPDVLDTAHSPLLSFVSRRVTETGEPGGAQIEGDITVRGVTRPIILDAVLYRPQGSVEGDLTNLTIVLTGALSRTDFGADGWKDFVGDEVRLTIRAHIHQAG